MHSHEEADTSCLLRDIIGPWFVSVHDVARGNATHPLLGEQKYWVMWGPTDSSDRRDDHRHAGTERHACPEHAMRKALSVVREFIHD